MNFLVIIPRNYAFFMALALASSFPETSSFILNNSKRTVQLQANAVTDSSSSESDTKINNRRYFLRITPVAVLSGITGVNILTSHSYPAFAKAKGDEEVELPTKEDVTERFNTVRYELQDPQGGVSYMQGRIDKEDFEGLLEFTRSYDLELRKLRMGKAKKLLQGKEIKARGTSYANAVTWDLIGMNKGCRPGQENIETAKKYLQELREDIATFLTLEETIEVQP
ncbi:hypothetical protein FRACYDRAFT_241847 [Fragilariopsis cylindrus CCMP1102]|uniref:Uncharacterized protein n=1 Tax=Fragilariopsis cylindrus CCMP1102 TaxID=635003 RepID=A0A1E7F5X3_9STRA|nr:hypothetical protein FRACYDRAFT_241847 [Fragilariopsis cylindrus CCMP1102]|eukprot:OEU13514.1 hypothetical protein FRACYDRAFT_241847 [Fragilariopsis cylindrus CCMP1102]